MSFGCIIFEAVVGEEGMWGEWHKADGDSSHEEDESMWESEYILFDSGIGGFSFLILSLLNTEYLVDRSNNISENIIFGYDIRIGKGTINKNKLISILIIPNNPINPISHQLQMMVWFSSREEKIYLTVLVLKNQFSSVFVREYTQNWVVRLVLHYHRFVLDVVVFQFVSVVQVDQEHLCHKELDHLTITLHWKYTLLWLTLNL